MEAVRDFIACETEGRGTDPARPSGVDAGLDLVLAVSTTGLDRNRSRPDAAAAVAAVAVGRGWLIPEESDPRSRL
jgi:hypothetical protein